MGSSSVPRELTERYGILSVTSREGRYFHADGAVEKPLPAKAPSCLTVIGRYILDHSIFSDLEAQAPGAGAEFQLTNSIARGIDRLGLADFNISGQRFDCGSKVGMLEATLFVANQNPKYAEVLRRYRAAPHRFPKED